MASVGPHLLQSFQSVLSFYSSGRFLFAHFWLIRSHRDTIGQVQDEPLAAMERMVGNVESVRREAGVQHPFTFSAVASDGSPLFAVRNSSDNNSPTLYLSQHVHALRVVDGSYETLPDNAIVVLSEPPDELTEHWRAVPEASFITVKGGETVIVPLTPKSA